MAVKNNELQGGETGQRRTLAEMLVVLAVLLFAVSGWAWWHFLRSSPENIFWGMVDNALRTSNVTRSANEKNESQNTLQNGVLTTSPKQHVIGQTNISQETSTGKISVVTDTIGTPYADFVKYAAIQSNEKDANGKKPDFKGVIGVWGKSPDAGKGQTAGQLYSQAVLGVFPFGNLSKSQRNELLNFIKSKNVYVTKFINTERQTKNHRPVYSYDVSVTPESYIAMLKMYAKMVGLTQLESVNPSDYKDTAALRFKVDVDVYSNQLAGLQPVGGTRTEIFASMGMIPSKLDLPNKTISISDLQAKLQGSR